MWKKVVMALENVMSFNLPGGTKEDYKKPPS
jgi:hypothetical protein